MRGWGDLGALGGMWGCWADVGDVVMGGKGAGMEGQGAAGRPGGCWEAAQGRALTLLSALHGSGGGQRLKVSRDRLPVRAPTSGQSSPLLVRSPHFRSSHTPSPPPANSFQSEPPISSPNSQVPTWVPHFRSDPAHFLSPPPPTAGLNAQISSQNFPLLLQPHNFLSEPLTSGLNFQLPV